MHVFRIIHPYKVPIGPCEHFGCKLQTESWTMTQFQDCISGLNPAVRHGSFLNDLIVDFEELTDQPSGHRSRWPTQLLRYFFNPHNWWKRRHVHSLITVIAKLFVSKWLNYLTRKWLFGVNLKSLDELCVNYAWTHAGSSWRANCHSAFKSFNPNTPWRQIQTRVSGQYHTIAYLVCGGII